MRLLAGLLLLTCWALPGVASADPSPTPTADLVDEYGYPGGVTPLDVADGWKNSPVYVEQSQRSLVPEDESARLAERVTGQDPAIRIAVVPANSLGLGSREEAARAFVDEVVDQQKADGIYLVVFGGAITWGSAVGIDTPIAEILTDELDKHSRSDPVGLLDGVLDELDVPGSSSGTPGWLWPLVIVLIVLVGLGASSPGRVRRRRPGGRRPAG